MKKLHKSNLFCWSVFDEDRNIDFHSYLWVRDGGNVIFDPLPLTEHDREHLMSLGTVSYIAISNSDHVRDAKQLADETGAILCGPAGESEGFPVPCAQWLDEGSDIIDGLAVFSLAGAKTEGELAFVVEGDTLITGDLIRAHVGGSLCLLPDGKLKDKEKAIESLKKIANIDGVSAILPGDGWPVFRNGAEVLSELLSDLLSE